MKSTYLGDIDIDLGDTKSDPDKKKKGDQNLNLKDFYDFSETLKKHIELIKNLRDAANSLQNAFDSLQKKGGLNG